MMPKWIASPKTATQTTPSNPVPAGRSYKGPPGTPERAMKILPNTTAQRCQRKIGLTAAGTPRPCPKRATMIVDDKPVCDCCASDLMAAECGRPVTIQRD